MTDYSLRPRLEEALSRGRIPGLSREEALTLDPDYRTKVGEAVIDLASRNIKDWLKNHGSPYAPNDGYNCFLDNHHEKGCIQDLPEELQVRFYVSLFSKDFSVYRDRFYSAQKRNKTPRAPFSAGEVLERLIVRVGYSRDVEIEKATSEAIKGAPWDDFGGFRRKVRKFYEEEDNKKIKSLEPRARKLFNDASVKLENRNDVRMFYNMDDCRIYSDGKSTLFLGGHAYPGVHLVYYDLPLMGNVGKAQKFLASILDPERDLSKMQKFVYDEGWIPCYLAMTAAIDTVLYAFPGTNHKLIVLGGAPFLPTAAFSSLVIRPRIQKHILNHQKQRLRQNPDFKFDEDAIKYLVEK